MRPFAFLGVFLIAVGIIVIYSTVKGSGKAGMAKVQAELTNIVKNESGRTLYTEYTFTHNGEKVRAVCPDKPKIQPGESAVMYYDISKKMLSTESAHRRVIAIGCVSAVLGVLVMYFQSALSEVFS